MREADTRRRWIPGRQTLNGNVTDDDPSPDPNADDEEEAGSRADATFDRSYGWLELNPADRKLTGR